MERAVELARQLLRAFDVALLKVDSDDARAAFGEWDGDPANPAALVEDSAAGIELAIPPAKLIWLKFFRRSSA